MKLKYLFPVIAALLLSFVVFIACEDSNENLVQDRGTYVVPNIEFTTAPVFTTDLESSFVEFTVSLNAGDAADGGDIEVLYNGEKPTKVQSFSSFPATVRLSASDIISKMGLDAASIQTSDVFSFFVLTTKNGVSTRSIASGNINIVCAFSPALSQGKYKAESADWDVAGNVTLTADPDDKYKIHVAGLETLDGVSKTPDVVFQIDPESYQITNKDKYVLSDDLEEDWGDSEYHGYTNYTYSILKGNYNSCNGEFSLVFNISCAKGDFGNFTFVFTPAE